MSESEEGPEKAAWFLPGQLVRHRLFEYRGVIVDVDAVFQLSDEWYDEMARSCPPKDQPWYHVLVDATEQMTYVAQRNLAADPTTEPIRHPMLDQFFTVFRNGRYHSDKVVN